MSPKPSLTNLSIIMNKSFLLKQAHNSGRLPQEQKDFFLLNWRTTPKQGWAIPGFGQQYYTQYYTGQNYAKLYNTLYQ